MDSKQTGIHVTINGDTSRTIIRTSKTNAEVAEKIKQVSHKLMEKNKQAYKELANMP